MFRNDCSRVFLSNIISQFRCYYTIIHISHTASTFAHSVGSSPRASVYAGTFDYTSDGDFYPTHSAFSTSLMYSSATVPGNVLIPRSFLVLSKVKITSFADRFFLFITYDSFLYQHGGLRRGIEGDYFFSMTKKYC